jgi:hypothetical protein
MWVPAQGGGGGILDGYEALLALDAKIEKVGLTPDEISKFPLVSVKAGGGSDGEEESCCICLEEFKRGKKAKQLPCSHSFHSLCISKWFKEHVVCPLCRFDCRALQPSNVG